MSEFVDRAQLHAKAGNGGAGQMSFRREAGVDKGGPDGGDGGDGGSIVLLSSTRLSSLISFRDHPFRRGEDGAHGMGKKKNGANGKDLEVLVPVGTVVTNLDGEVIADLHSPEIAVTVTRGGRGGKGNAGFLSNRRRAPAFAEQGEVGEEFWFNLELKLAADVALVGFPNVGKSSIISVVSRARPKIANYPFTTLIPSLGVVRLGRGEVADEMVMADVPGLIEGASEGRGLGFEFLRHIERARVLAIVIDLTGEIGVSPEEQIRILLHELANYMPQLLTREMQLVGNKADLLEEPGSSEALLSRLAEEHGAGGWTLVSTVTRHGLDRLVGRLFESLQRAKAAEESIFERVTVFRPAPRFEFKVEKSDAGYYEISGRDAVRAVRLSDLASPEALDIIHKRLDRMGIMKSLKRMGVREGDEVRVGELSFTYEPGI